jgi:hypothetical protein
MGLRKKLFGSRKRKAGVAILALLLISGSAFAGWLVLTATGSGSAKAGTLSAPTISNASAPSGGMFPSGNLDSPFQATVNNPNTGTLYIKSVGPLNTTNVVGGTAQCDWSTAPIKAHLLVKMSATTGLSIAVPSGASQVSIPGLVGLDATTPTDCQGTTINGIGITNVQFDTAP